MKAAVWKTGRGVACLAGAEKNLVAKKERARERGRDPFNQNFRKFRSKTQWIGSVQPEKFRKNESTFWGGPLFPVGPIGILVKWIAPYI